jgi:hypothetical protein
LVRIRASADCSALRSEQVPCLGRDLGDMVIGFMSCHSWPFYRDTSIPGALIMYITDLASWNSSLIVAAVVFIIVTTVCGADALIALCPSVCAPPASVVVLLRRKYLGSSVFMSLCAQEYVHRSMRCECARIITCRSAPSSPQHCVRRTITKTIGQQHTITVQNIISITETKCSPTDSPEVTNSLSTRHPFAFAVHSAN